MAKLETKGTCVLPNGVRKNFVEICECIDNLIALNSEEKGAEKTIELLTKDRNSLEYVYNKLNNICNYLLENKGFKFIDKE